MSAAERSRSDDLDHVGVDELLHRHDRARGFVVARGFVIARAAAAAGEGGNSAAGEGGRGPRRRAGGGAAGAGPPRWWGQPAAPAPRARERGSCR